MATGETVPATCVVTAAPGGIVMMLVDGADTPIPALLPMGLSINLGSWAELVLRTPAIPHINNGGS